MCSAPNICTFVYILIGARIVPLIVLTVGVHCRLQSELMRTGHIMCLCLCLHSAYIVSEDSKRVHYVLELALTMGVHCRP